MGCFGNFLGMVTLRLANCLAESSGSPMLSPVVGGSFCGLRGDQTGSQDFQFPDPFQGSRLVANGVPAPMLSIPRKPELTIISPRPPPTSRLAEKLCLRNVEKRLAPKARTSVQQPPPPPLQATPKREKTKQLGGSRTLGGALALTLFNYPSDHLSLPAMSPLNPKARAELSKPPGSAT